MRGQLHPSIRVFAAVACLVLGVAFTVFKPHDPDPTLSPAAALTKTQLDRKLPRYFANHVSLREDLDDLGRAAGVKIQLDEDALRKDGRTLETPITLGIGDISARTALARVLKSMPNIDSYLVPIVTDDGVIHITVSTAAAKFSVVRAYDVGDLLNLRPPRAVLTRDALCDMLTRYIAPESWKCNTTEGWGEVHAGGSTITVLQSPQNQFQIARELKSLRQIWSAARLSSLLTRSERQP